MRTVRGFVALRGALRTAAERVAAGRLTTGRTVRAGAAAGAGTGVKLVALAGGGTGVPAIVPERVERLGRTVGRRATREALLIAGGGGGGGIAEARYTGVRTTRAGRLTGRTGVVRAVERRVLIETDGAGSRRTESGGGGGGGGV